MLSVAGLRLLLLQVRNFKAGLDLFSRIGEVAEAEGHHPDLHLVGYNQVYAELSTHSVGESSPSLICECSPTAHVDLEGESWSAAQA